MRRKGEKARERRDRYRETKKDRELGPLNEVYEKKPN